MKLRAKDRAALRAVRGGADELQRLLQSVEELDLPREQQVALGELAAAGCLLATQEFHAASVLNDVRARLSQLHGEANSSGVLT